LLHKQTLAIASSLLEEIELHDFSNPTGGFTGTPTQANRASFDDVLDYNGFATTGIYPADGSATVVSGLSAYSVSVAISSITWSGAPAYQIEVTVTAPNGESLSALGYRVDY
jgi:hypothetical protein